MGDESADKVRDIEHEETHQGGEIDICRILTQYETLIVVVNCAFTHRLYTSTLPGGRYLMVTPYTVYMLDVATVTLKCM